MILEWSFFRKNTPKKERIRIMSFNPFDIQKQVFGDFEKNIGEYLQKTMREPAFMKIVAQNMSASLDVRGLIKEQLEKVLKGLDIPTNTTMEGLYKTVHDLETRLLDLEEQVEDLSDDLKKAVKRAEKAEAKAHKGSPHIKEAVKVHGSSKNSQKSSNKKSASKKAGAKKATPKKATPKKAAPKKAAPKKAAPKKTASKKSSK